MQTPQRTRMVAMFPWSCVCSAMSAVSAVWSPWEGHSARAWCAAVAVLS